MKQNELNGLTNVITLIKNEVVKTSQTISDYYIKRINEQLFYQQIQDKELTFLIKPTSYGFNKENKFISKYLYYPNAFDFSGRTTELSIQTLRDVKSLIDQFHKVDVMLPTFNPSAFLMLFQTKVGTIEQLTPYTEKVNSIIKNYYSHSPKIVLSHNDLVAGNFLWVENKWKLIDFEMVAYNHYLFDYASFISETCSENETKRFLELLALDNEETHELNNLIFYQNYLWAYWAKYMFQETKLEVYNEIFLDKLKKITNYNFNKF